MWDLPRPGLEPVSPALAGRFSTTAPPGKPPIPSSATLAQATALSYLQNSLLTGLLEASLAILQSVFHKAAKGIFVK